MTDLETRIRRGLTEYVEATPVSDAAPFVPVAARRRYIRLVAPVMVAAATLTILLAAVALVRPGSGGPHGASEGAASIPTEFAGYSVWTGTVEDSPPGRAVAVYRYTNDNIPWPDQVIALAADAHRYRNINETRTGLAGKEPAPFLLSGDGTRVAIGSGPRAMSEIPVVDLATGHVARYTIDADSTVTLLAWSADGRNLAYATRPFRPMPDSYGESLRARGGQLRLLDLDTGRTDTPTTPDLPTSVAYAAFSPDGTLLAVQAGGPEDGAEQRQSPPGRLLVVRLSDGVVVATAPTPSYYRLANQAAWSPDGRRLALTPETQFPSPETTGAWLRTMEISPSGAWQPGPAVTGASGFFLGWQTPDRVVVRTSEIMAVDLNGGSSTVLSQVDVALEDDVYIVDLQLAYALLPELRTRPAGEPDRGPWPTWLRVTVAVATLAVLLPLALAAVVVRARVRRRRS